MEESKDTPEQARPAQFMDVQPPSQTSVSEQSVVEAPDVATESTTATDSLAGPSQELSPGQSAAASDTEKAPVLAASAHHERTHKTPILAIMCAVIIAGVLAGVAVVSFTSSQHQDSNKDAGLTQSQSTEQKQQSNSASAADVDKASASIDEQLTSLDDTSDYSDSPVSDTTLGL